MNQLQEVLLVQLILTHGVHNYAHIAKALGQHPLVTSQEGPKPDFTADGCRLTYEQICEREVTANKGIAQTESGSVVNAVWQVIQPRYLSWLKKQLRDDEEQYEMLRMLTEKSTDTKGTSETDALTEVPSSTQDTADEAMIAKKTTARAGRKGQAKKAQDIVEVNQHGQPGDNGEMSEDVDMADETDDARLDALQKTAENSESDTHNHVDASEKDSLRSANIEDLSAAEESAAVQGEGAEESEKRLSVASDSPLAPDEQEQLDVEKSEPADSAIDAKKSSVKQDTEIQPSLGRTTRTRSSTMNTVSSDVPVADEQASTPIPAKKRAGRPSKKQLAREESLVGTPEETQSLDDSETAAAVKRFQSTIVPVLGSITSHRYASVFGNPVSDKDAPNYSKVVRYPMDLKTLRMQIKSGEIGNVVSFQCAIFRMLSNAVMYNAEDSEVASMARDLLYHVEEAISLYKAAEGYAEPAEDRTPKRRRRNEA